MRLRIFERSRSLHRAPCGAGTAGDAKLSRGAGRLVQVREDRRRRLLRDRCGAGARQQQVVVVNDTDVLIVDCGTSPAAARAFVDDIKKLTDKPIRYVVNTHWHYDHTAGNQISGRKCRSSRPIIFIKCWQRSTCCIASRS